MAWLRAEGSRFRVEGLGFWPSVHIPGPWALRPWKKDPVSATSS